ncbi:RNA polymerase sigma70 factor [Clostridium acetobutylicum]|nr:RNA polymerase sigma70 factor [Clostridium acetobutylicum]
MNKVDEEIVEGILKRDLNSFNKLIECYGIMIHNVVTSILNKSHESQSIEECVDDILMCIWRNMDCFSKERGSLKCWIIVISKNKALDYKKKLKKIMNSIDIDNVKLNSLVDIEQDYLKEENKKSIIELLNNLSIKDKEIFIKRYMNDWSIEKISKDMGLTSIAVYNRLSRGRKKLKKVLSVGKEG